MRVFKVNDCDWVAAKTFEEAKEWYMKEYDLVYGDDECWLEYEENLNSSMWVETDYLNEEELTMAHIFNDAGQVRKPFRWVMERIYENKQTPYLIASTEY